MSRLIDADKLIDKLIDESIYEWVDGNGKIDISYVRALIYKQPTAYDLDKVVEELERQRKGYEDVSNEAEKRGDDRSYLYNRGRQRGFEGSKEVVKWGGIDE